jgi:hypothetical protein
MTNTARFGNTVDTVDSGEYPGRPLGISLLVITGFPVYPVADVVDLSTVASSMSTSMATRSS